MATGNDARIGVALETTPGTRVAPTRFFPFISEGIDYSYQRVTPPVLGLGPWTRASRTSTQSGSGPIVMPVTTTGFGYWINLLHGNTVTPTQQASTAAYLQTHTLTNLAARAATIQVQSPPVSSSTLIPQEFAGAKVGTLELSWGNDQELRASFSVTPMGMSTSQTLATYVAPSSWSFFTFQDGSVTIGGSPVTAVGGSGTLTITIPLRDDFYPMGGSGTIAEPILTDKPTVTATFTADFNDLTHWNRTANNTIADLVVKFQHPTAIASTYYPYFQVTVPDCFFTSPRPQVDGPGPLQQTVTAENGSSVGNPVVIEIQSTDTVI